MPRFQDEWVVDRVLFDYVSGGSCACCGMQHFLPNGTADLIAAVSDLETDQQTMEINALHNKNHPWPPDLRDQVWADRVRLRQKLKRDKASYQTLWHPDNEAEKHAFLDWCRAPSTVAQYKRWFQLSRSEVMEMVQQTYNIHSAFGVVLCAVLEQVASFHLTGYPPDGRGSIEVDFESLLTFDRRGGFTLVLVEDDGVTVKEESLQIWLRHMEHTVGSPGKQLLLRKASSTDNDGENDKENDDNDGGDPDGPADKSSAATSDPKTSFASDRRILRLLIARIWSAFLEKKFRQHQQQQAEENELPS